MWMHLTFGFGSTSHLDLCIDKLTLHRMFYINLLLNTLHAACLQMLLELISVNGLNALLQIILQILQQH